MLSTSRLTSSQQQHHTPQVPVCYYERIVHQSSTAITSQGRGSTQPFLGKTHRPTSDFALVRLSSFRRRELPAYIAQLHAHFTVFTSVHCTRKTTVQLLVLREVGSQPAAGSWKSAQLQLEMESVEFHKFLKAVHKWGSGTSSENVPFASYHTDRCE